MAVAELLLDLVPTWFRSRWPLRRFYWQQWELDEARRGGEVLAELLADPSDLPLRGDRGRR